jgi:uncharacterized protein
MATIMDYATGGPNMSASPWFSRIVSRDRVGVADVPSWLSHSYREFHRNVTDPAFPCYFGTQAENRGEMYYGFVSGSDLSHLPATMAKFVQLSSMLENQRNNFAVFFEPSHDLTSHEPFQALCWRVLQFLHDHDSHPMALEQPDASDASWEFCFGGMQMFVVGCSPTYARRRSRNIGPGVVMLFQPRSVFIDKITNREISVEARAIIRKRLVAWDRGVPPHPDLGIYGDQSNREWKQYFLPDDNAPVTGMCPFLNRRRKPANEKASARAFDFTGAGVDEG